MKLAIMQPYLFPYIGYFQLMKMVDEFVVYDNIEYTKKGWINRNRILINGAAATISFPLKKDSDYLSVRDRELSDTWSVERAKLLNRIKENYRKAPFFEKAFRVVTEAILFEERNLFSFIFNSLEVIKSYLLIETSIKVSSSVPIDHSLRAEDKVVAICKACQADTYINPIGGLGLYDKTEFLRSGIELHFIQTSNFEYHQFGSPFVPHLSIIDVMMFNSVEAIGELLDKQFVLV